MSGGGVLPETDVRNDKGEVLAVAAEGEDRAEKTETCIDGDSLPPRRRVVPLVALGSKAARISRSSPVRVRSQAQKRPTPSPKVAVEKPRRLNPFIRESTMMKTPATKRPATRPCQAGSSAPRARVSRRAHR